MLIKETFQLNQGKTILDFGNYQSLILLSGEGEGTLLLRVVEGGEDRILELPDLAGEISLYGNEDAGSLVIGSSLGGHVYAVDLNLCEKTCEVSLKRDNYAGERQFALYTTPNLQRVVVVSELVIVVLGWDGAVLMAHPLTSSVIFEGIEDGSIRLYDRSLEADVSYKIPR